VNKLVDEPWRETRLKNLFSARIGGSWGDEPEEDNSFVCIRAADFETDQLCHRHVDLTRRGYEKSEIERKKLLPGDLIIEKSGGGDNQPVGRVVSFDLPEIALCSNFLEILRPDHEQLYQRYGAYLMYSLWVQRLVTRSIKQTTGIQNLDEEAYLDIQIQLPSVQKQRSIADHLDRETAKIDAMVAAKERLLELLAEKRRSIITRAVTSGLNPNAPLRDSGIPWLGWIPAHWKQVPLRFLTTFVSGATPDKGNDDYWNGSIPWVSPKDMKRDEIADSEDHITDEALNNSTLKMIPVDSVLVVVRGMILAHSFPVAIATGLVTINQDMKALSCKPSLEPPFLQAVLKGARDWIISLTDESSHGTKKLDTEVLGRFEVPVPPLPEQRAIVTYITRETAKLDALKEAAERTIGLLKERRIALISAAVTGQIEVRSQA
jgi:type I restriction enzyme, S subunit